MKRQAGDDTSNIGKKRKKFDLSKREGHLGLIESVAVQNFMCHENLTLSLGPHMNCIIGENGSGKSAILTAIILALGGKSSATDRYSNIKGFVKSGRNKGKIEVVLRNAGVTAYKPEVYGEKITVVREFNKEGISSYKIKSESGTICSNQKRELTNIMEAMDILVDNPLCVLTQEKSKKFLVSKEARPEKLYELFYKGTGLETLEIKYQSMVNTKDEAKAELERKKSSIPEMKAELEKLDKFVGSAKKISIYKNELLWATVIEMEKLFKEKEEGYLKLLENIKDHEDSLEECKIKHEEKSLELKEFLKQKENSEKTMKDYRTALESLKEERDELAPILREKEQSLRKLNEDEKQLITDLIALEEDIENQQEKKLSTIAEEKRQCELAIQKLSMASSEIDVIIRNNSEQRSKKLAEHSDTEKNIGELRAEIHNHNFKNKKCTENLMKARDALQNKANAFGEHTVKVLQEIQSRRNQFIKLPIGPIGVHLEVKQPKYTLAIESAIGNSLLKSFCVDNYQDSTILRDILRKYYKTPPSIVVSRFEYGRFDVSGNAAQSTFPTVLEMLTIKNDIVANCLIDQAQIEKKLLVENASASVKLMNKPPKNCRSAYLLNCDQICFNPSRFYSFGKFLPRSILNSIRPEDIKNLERACENEAVESRKKSKYIKTLELQLQVIQREINSLGAEIIERVAEKKKINDKVKDLQCREEPKDMNCLQEDLLKVQNEYNKTLTKKRSCEEEVSEYTTKRDEANKKIEMQMSLLQSSNQKYHKLCMKINELNKDKEALMSGKTKFENELKTLKNRSESCHSEICDAKQKIEIARKNAQKNSKYIVTGRSCEEIRRLIEETEKVIQTQSNCDRESLQKKFLEKKKNICRAENELYRIEKYLARIDDMIKFRSSKFKDIRIQTEVLIDMAFIAILSGNGYRGRIEFDSLKRALNLNVTPRAGEKGRKNQSSLSGGERSFVTIAFLLALWERTKIPFRVLDEYDVFMDSNNRQLSVDLLKKKAEEMAETQFIFLSPLDLPRIQQSDFIQIIKMAAPKRKNEDINENSPAKKAA
ncbi:structural maintenance of chromosomes protein 6 [Nephila pilipes]|uniref:Structural maintenance of chromosomes protein 6 n=1 Tax=Nephila pilipes TaxID=299642 RepID=A0A8X6PGW6_NEPPI|nr:structural maintenance of chromosomes protein 6 [Nephila pilipes]